MVVMKRIILTDLFLIALILLGLLLGACTPCRYTVMSDAAQAYSQGYQEVRIVSYPLSFWAKADGLFLWGHHAELQVRQGDRWLFWNNDNPGETGKYEPQRIMYVFTPIEWLKAQRQHGGKK
jgi:hypothetical protein